MEKLEHYKKKYGDIYYKFYLVCDVQKFQDLYADLYFFEVYLKYNIDEEFSQHFGTDWKKNITYWEDKGRHSDFIKNGNIHLGFWVSLFDQNFRGFHNYCNTINIANIFIGININVDTIYQDLKYIKDCRNYIAHFKGEEIDDILELKELIQKYIKALACDKFFVSNRQNNTIILNNDIDELAKKPLLFFGIYHNTMLLKEKIEEEYINKCIKNNHNIEIINLIDKEIIRDGNLYNDVIKKINNNNNNIKIIIANKAEINNDFFSDINNKTKFITTLEELPNLLNKIQNDNAN